MTNHKIVLTCILCSALSALSGCGGGGSSSSGAPANPPPTNPPPPTLPPSGGIISNGGLLPGGVALVVNTGTIGVALDVAVGGTGLSIGDIQGFSSIILNDTTINTDNASFVVEGISAQQSVLQQGQQVLIIGDAATDTAEQVLYRSNIRGPVTAITIEDLATAAATITIFGQTVITDATTAFANTGLADLLVGDFVEVSGVSDDTGALVATFIEQESGLTEFKVTGEITQLTPTQFQLNNLVVDYASATLNEFDGDMISDGDIIEVRGPSANFSAPANLVATSVERLPSVVVGTDTIVRIEGFIDTFVSSTEFAVQTTPIITTSNTVFTNGTDASLGLGVKIQLIGTQDQDGVVVAEQIAIQSTDAIRAEGNVEAIDIVNRTVTVLETTFLIRDLTRIEDDSNANLDPFTLNDLGIGDEVEIRGYLDGNTVVATRIEREDNEDRAELRGPVTAENAAAGTLSLIGVMINTSGATQFEDANDMNITQSEFFDTVELGTVVKAEWDIFSSTSVAVDELSIEN